MNFGVRPLWLLSAGGKIDIDTLLQLIFTRQTEKGLFFICLQQIWEEGRRLEKLRGSNSHSRSFASSSSRGFVIKFVSDRTVSRKGFRAIYTSCKHSSLFNLHREYEINQPINTRSYALLAWYYWL